MADSIEKKEWTEEILQQFDDAAKDYLFPMPNNFSLYNAGMRINVFLNNKEWLIVFEMINYDKSRTFLNEISAYGNMVDTKGVVAVVEVIEPGLHEYFWDERGVFLLDRFKFTVRIRGKEYTFVLTEQDYQDAGIDIKSKSPIPVQILRIISEKKQEALFLSDGELLEKCGRSDANLVKFLQLDEWHHPDIADDELPSDNPCFRSLAEAIAKSDKTIYNCPQESVNSHWSHWELDEHRGWE